MLGGTAPGSDPSFFPAEPAGHLFFSGGPRDFYPFRAVTELLKLYIMKRDKTIHDIRTPDQFTEKPICSLWAHTIFSHLQQDFLTNEV